MRQGIVARWVPALALAGCSLPVAAQGPGAVTQLPATPVARVERLEVSLWPEYDRPAMLVLYHASLPADAKLPATVSLPIPAVVGMPHAVAMKEAAGRLLNAQFTREVTGEWAHVVILTDTPSVQLEYYAELLIDGPRRRFVFSWPGGPELTHLVFDVQQPPGAEGLTLVPPATGQSTHPDGLTYHQADLGAFRAGQSARLEVTYQKTSSTLTAPAQAAPAAAPAGSASPEPAAPASETDPALLVVFGLVAVVVIAFLFATRPGVKKK